MKLPVPLSDMHTQVQIIARSDSWEQMTTVDDSHRTVEINPPKGVSEDDVEVIAQFLNKLAKPDTTMLPVCMKERVIKPKLEKKEPAKKPEPKADDQPKYQKTGPSDVTVTLDAPKE